MAFDRNAWLAGFAEENYENAMQTMLEDGSCLAVLTEMEQLSAMTAERDRIRAALDHESARVDTVTRERDTLQDRNATMTAERDALQTIVAGGKEATRQLLQDLSKLNAQSNRLEIERDAAIAAHELEKRAHERTWLHKAKMIAERDAALKRASENELGWDLCRDELQAVIAKRNETIDELTMDRDYWHEMYNEKT